DRFIERARQRRVTTSDILATLTAFTAHSVADQYRRFLPGRPDEVILGGGGSRNPTLVRLLSQLLDLAQIRIHDDFGLPSLVRGEGSATRDGALGVAVRRPKSASAAAWRWTGRSP